MRGGDRAIRTWWRCSYYWESHCQQSNEDDRSFERREEEVKRVWSSRAASNQWYLRGKADPAHYGFFSTRLHAPVKF